MLKKVQTIAQLLKRPDKGKEDANNALAVLARSIYDIRAITPREFDKLVTEYVTKKYPDNDKLRSSAKSNLNRSFADADLTWKTFVRLLNIFKIRKAVFTLQLEWPDRKVTYHQKTLTDGHDEEDDESDK